MRLDKRRSEPEVRSEVKADVTSQNSSDGWDVSMFVFALVNPFVRPVRQALELTEPAPKEHRQKLFFKSSRKEKHIPCFRF